MNLLERNYAFGIGKRILEVCHRLRVILRETAGALLQINPMKGYGQSSTIRLNLDNTN